MDILIAMVIEGHVIGIEAEPFKQNIDPTGPMEIVIFEKIDESLWVERELFHIVEHTEKGARFSPLSDFDRLPLNKVISCFGCVEKESETDARVDRREEISMAPFSAKTFGAFFMRACRRIIAMADKDLDDGPGGGGNCFPFPEPHVQILGIRFST